MAPILHIHTGLRARTAWPGAPELESLEQPMDWAVVRSSSHPIPNYRVVREAPLKPQLVERAVELLGFNGADARI